MAVNPNGMRSSNTRHISIVVDDDIDTTLAEALQDSTMKNLTSNLPFSDICCIFRVPPVLRRNSPTAYQPDVLSIGPFHRGRGTFQFMETMKQWYLHNLLSRMNISLKLLIEAIIKVEKRALDFYSEPLNQSGFMEMMVLDGCFLLKLFRKFRGKEHMLSDPIFNTDCMLQYIFHDLLLLENQIPWIVLECLYTLITLDDKDDHSLGQLVLTVLGSHHELAHGSSSYLHHLNNNSVVHDEDEILHILDLIRTTIIFPFKDQFDSSSYDSKTELMHPAFLHALAEAGVKFRRPSSTDMMNIEFYSKNGTLAIAQLAIGELTDSLFRNLIAFEQCYPVHTHKITSYAILMDNLISSTKDMEFLCEKKKIDNWLSAEDASKFIVKLYYDTALNKFYYGGLCSKLNKHYGQKWNKMEEKFKRTYCSDPWKVISLTAAFILLVMTLLQTIYTIVPYHQGRF